MEQDLSSGAITSGLKTRFIGQRVIYLPAVTSTMEVARREAQQGAPEGTIVLADEQTAGKGRVNRLWLSPRGSIALSVILRPPLVYLSTLIMLASLAVVHCIEAVTGLKPQLKWPNDVLVNGKKVCGILIESDVRKDRVNYAVIGIGINANVTVSDLPELRPIATSLSDELGQEVSRLDLIRCLLVEFEKLYLALLDGASIYEEWRGRLITLGRRVRVRAGETVLEGVAESVARDGKLLLRRPDGSLEEIVAGDVTLRDAN